MFKDTRIQGSAVDQIITIKSNTMQMNKLREVNGWKLLVK